ncbi:FAR1-related sequence 10 [Tanacetum coccineum]
MKIHHGGRFTDLPRRKYVDGEVAFVDLTDTNQCLDIGLRLLASDTDIDKILKYVHKQKIIYVYVEHDKSVVDHALNVDEVGPSKILRCQNGDGEDEAAGEEDEANDVGQSKEEDEGDDDDKDIKDMVDEEHIVDEVEVKMNGFKFEVETDAKESARRKGLRKLRKEEGNSTLKTSSFVRKEFTNRDLAKEMRQRDIRSRQKSGGINKRIAKGKKVNVHDKGKDKMVIKEEEDKLECPWVLYISKGDKGLDGAFMRGQYLGQLLIVVGVDANNGIYPVAYGIVESESSYSWTWFLTCLGDDLDLFSNSNFTFITDRQKGLLPVIAKLFPAAEHRYYVRHIHENMNMTWKGSEYKEMLWNHVTAYIVVDFNRRMDTLKGFKK